MVSFKQHGNVLAEDFDEESEYQDENMDQIYVENHQLQDMVAANANQKNQILTPEALQEVNPTYKSNFLNIKKKNKLNSKQNSLNFSSID